MLPSHALDQSFATLVEHCIKQGKQQHFWTGHLHFSRGRSQPEIQCLTPGLAHAAWMTVSLTFLGGTYKKDENIYEKHITKMRIIYCLCWARRRTQKPQYFVTPALFVTTLLITFHACELFNMETKVAVLSSSANTRGKKERKEKSIYWWANGFLQTRLEISIVKW